VRENSETPQCPRGGYDVNCCRWVIFFDLGKSKFGQSTSIMAVLWTLPWQYDYDQGVTLKQAYFGSLKRSKVSQASPVLTRNNLGLSYFARPLCFLFSILKKTCVYIYNYIHTHTYIYICIYIYVYTYTILLVCILGWFRLRMYYPYISLSWLMFLPYLPFLWMSHITTSVNTSDLLLYDIFVCMCMYMCIYIYIYRERERMISQYIP